MAGQSENLASVMHSMKTFQSFATLVAKQTAAEEAFEARLAELRAKHVANEQRWYERLNGYHHTLYNLLLKGEDVAEILKAIVVLWVNVESKQPDVVAAIMAGVQSAMQFPENTPVLAFRGGNVGWELRRLQGTGLIWKGYKGEEKWLLRLDFAPVPNDAPYPPATRLERFADHPAGLRRRDHPIAIGKEAIQALLADPAISEAAKAQVRGVLRRAGLGEFIQSRR